MTKETEPVRKEGLSFPIQGVVFFVLHCAFVQGMQASARGLSLEGLATSNTILAARFEGAALVVFVAALVVAFRERSLAVFKPGVLKLQAGRAAMQAGQSAFIVLAATQLSGGFQAAISLVSLPLWVTIIGQFVKTKTGQRIDRRAWLGVLGYAMSAALLMTQAAIGKGSMWIGILYMLCSGACTASLQFLTKAAADERKLTATLWQNGPAALLCIPLWYHSVAGNAAVRLPIAWLGWVLIASLVACSLIQQVAVQVAFKRAENTSVPQLNSLRGVQIWVGTLLDRVCFGITPTAVNILAIPVVGMAIVNGWNANKPKKVAT